MIRHKGILKLSLDCICVSVLACGASFANAELKSIGDEELSQYVGQAAIAFDVTENGADAFTRFTVGLDTEFQINTNNVVLGEYTQAGESNSADVQVSNLSFGHISTDGVNPQLNGLVYAENEIVPFEAIDPYFELAESNGQLVGFRVGFGGARGTLSGDWASLSGNIGLKLDDGSGTIKDAQLLDASGAADNYRASYIGLADATTDCVAGVLCAPLSNLKTLDIGQKETDGTVSQTTDLFFSFQTQAVSWQNPSGTSSIDTQPGAYLNLPTSMQLDMTQLSTGIDRVRTEYIDRGLGLF
ncbi:MAG: hypothetical protein H7A00_09060 [Hahellaceae bacterium]|nr:hypothetical protein [Hahellaceae bacterium]